MQTFNANLRDADTIYPRAFVLIIAAAGTFLLAAGHGRARELAGQIVDVKTGAPIAEAIVTAGFQQPTGKYLIY